MTRVFFLATLLLMSAQTALVRQLYVVIVGTMFAASDPGRPLDEWLGTFTLDNKFKYKAVVAAP